MVRNRSLEHVYVKITHEQQPVYWDQELAGYSPGGQHYLAAAPLKFGPRHVFVYYNGNQVADRTFTAEAEGTRVITIRRDTNGDFHVGIQPPD